MNLYQSKMYIEDNDMVLRECKWINQFEGKSVLVTGATGLICSSVVDLLLFHNEQHDDKITVFVAGRSEERVANRFSRFRDSQYLKFIKYDAHERNVFNFYVDYIIHGAGNAYPAAIQKYPVETMKDNFLGMIELLDYSDKYHVINTVYISSSEIYGCKESIEPLTENDYGFVDILNPRSSYSISKRATETLCSSYAYEKNLRVSIVRPGHIYGPTARLSDNRVSSVFAYNAANKKNIVLKSEGTQIRSYCYMLDCATAILMIALKGKSSTAYNVSNPRSVMSIKEIATLFAEFGGVKLCIDLPTESERAAFNPMQNSALNSMRLQRLGWTGLFNCEKGTAHTIQVIKEAKNNVSM